MAKTKVKVSVTGKDAVVQVNEHAPHPHPHHARAIGDLVNTTEVEGGEHATIELGENVATVIISE